ncbi:hypothetical protein RHMOL_Rhmol09G0018100 [Rhododendron molle]|uniref:Uncharacterized protein n=1 Tax=Rhododendron molle TaxID=49168 RepID=A0ACC0M9B6_RHOML|nr:hypothetical protein RHMOL_Rhmol09G0018100 [Rhododendron molle]
MASRAILRKRRFVSDYLNVSARSIQCFQSLGLGLSSQHADSHGPNSAANHSSGDIDRMKKGDTILPINEDLLNFSALGLFRRKCYGDMVSGYVTGGSQFGSPTGMRLKLQSVRYASTAAAGQRDVDAKIGRDHDGKVKEVAAAAMNFISNVSKDIDTVWDDVLGMMEHLWLWDDGLGSSYWCVTGGGGLVDSFAPGLVHFLRIYSDISGGGCLDEVAGHEEGLRLQLLGFSVFCFSVYRFRVFYVGLSPLWESYPVVGVFLLGYCWLVSDFVRCDTIFVDPNVAKSSTCGSSI